MKRCQTFAAIVVLLLAACSSATPESEVGATPTISSVVTSGGEAEAVPRLGGPDAPACIAPANPGGGFGVTCSSFATVFESLGLADEVTVSFNPGAGGGVAFAEVVTQRPDDPNLLVATSRGTTLRLAQGQFGRFDEFDVRWVASMAVDRGVLAVRPGSQFETLDDLVDQLLADPASVRFGGGSAVGGQDHMKVLLLAETIGIDPRDINYIPFEGGGEALSALQGDFVDVFPGDTSETLAGFERGDIEILATLTEDPVLGPMESIPTAREEGVDVVWETFRGFWAPPQISEEEYAYWVETLADVAESPEWAASLRSRGLEVQYIGGQEFEEHIYDQVTDMRDLSQRFGFDLSPGS